MDDYLVIGETCLSGLKLIEAFKNEPEFIRIEIDPEHKDVFEDCLENAKPLCDGDYIYTALGMFLSKVYPNQDTTE
ncbi:hypothetical protein PMX70_02180 [Collinsella aerofaciens]|uniref:hypothetical protein n=1 Tax=Collinsella aerofaciens TaxID=74426 RepID=UPI00232AE14C|nr:hypothetical protein [Collinsella aerofaciens]MDB1905903.1 hypothetical protein [Collinsella aerofaciens]